MGCFIVLFGAFAPRLVLFLWWLLGDRLSFVYDSFILPFLGFLFLPYTTLFYAIAWSPTRGVSGFGWFVVIFAFLVDIGNWFGGDRERRRRSTPMSA